MHTSGLLTSNANIITPLGEMMAAATAQGLCLLEFADTERGAAQLSRLEKRLGAVFTPGAAPIFSALQAQLDEYFAGRRRQFELPLHLVGTTFQQRVWASLQAIAYGERRTYRRQAEEIGQPSALRALGKANGDNPIAILVPCHRLVGSDGSLTGYGGGLWRKAKLLELESAASRRPFPEQLTIEAR
jgi:AraC family transcriptional regulator of adaptative response/methylated-DNA-[protein]-cysteine methyltransferase